MKLKGKIKKIKMLFIRIFVIVLFPLVLISCANNSNLFNNLNSDLVPFLNNESPSKITELCGKTAENVAYATYGPDVDFSLLSGGFTILDGGMVPDNGSKIVISILSDKVKIIAITGDAGKVAKVEEVTFQEGAEIKFTGKKYYIFNGTTWEKKKDVKKKK